MRRVWRPSRTPFPALLGRHQLRQARTEHRGELTALRAEHAGELTALRREHREELGAERQRADTALETLRAEHRRETDTLQAALTAVRTEPQADNAPTR